jgi:hypothetical protein
VTVTVLEPVDLALLEVAGALAACAFFVAAAVSVELFTAFEVVFDTLVKVDTALLVDTLVSLPALMVGLTFTAAAFSEAAV